MCYHIKNRIIFWEVTMNNFAFYSPTYFVFGKDEENNAGKYVKKFGGTLGSFVVLNEKDIENIYRLML